MNGDGSRAGTHSLLPFAIPKISPYLQTQTRSDSVTQEARIGLQGVDEEVGIFCGLVEVLVLSEIEVLQAGQGHHTWSTRQPSARLPLSVLCAFVEDRGPSFTQK